MNYIGSKKKLLPFIQKNIFEIVPDTQDKIFCEPFAGTAVVSKAMKPYFSKLIICDDQPYAEALAMGHVYYDSELPEYLAMLQETPPVYDGPIYVHYSPHGGRNYFTEVNAGKIDAVRRMLTSPFIDEHHYYYGLVSLLEAADRIANVAVVYGSYLKKFKKSALKPLLLRNIEQVKADARVTVYRANANKLIEYVTGDVLYLDPPYNNRQYGANYHMLNSITRGVINAYPRGVSGMTNYTSSPYCSKPVAKEVLERLLRLAKFKHIFLSYNNEGIISTDEIRDIMGKCGKYERFETKYPRFLSHKDKPSQYVTEYLHYLEKAG